MKRSDGFSVTQPVSIWNREIRTDFKQFFLNLALGAVNCVMHDWTEGSQHAQAALSAMGLAQENCGARAWLLIHRALTEAVFELAEENTLSFQQTVASPETFGAALDVALEHRPLSLDHRFFSHPERLPILGDVQRALTQWLESGGEEPAQARCIAQRLPSYFVCALNNQWREKREEYACLQTQVSTPFTQAARRERHWNHYRARLQKQVNAPLFDAPFSLRDIYIPLRGFYEEKRARPTSSWEGGQRKRVVDLQTHLMTWLHDAKPRDAVRVVCGGPGSGKTSFAKMFAATVAQAGEIPLLFIPMHLFPFQADLVQALQTFVAADPCFDHYFPLSGEDPQERLFLIFDGLDELAMQGEQVAESARHFVASVGRKTAQWNQRSARLQVLITERTPLCAVHDDPVRMPGQVLHLLSYSPQEASQQGMYDPDGHLKTDQRHPWWTAYARIRGMPHLGMPPALNTRALAEITAQPLLNHLVALGLEAGRVDVTRESNRNVLYRDLITGIFKRRYEEGRNPAIQGFEEEGFVRMLEEVAVAVWHGQGRTATLTAIETRFQDARQHRPLASGRQAPREGVTRLLTAFPFCKAGMTPGGEEMFGFTHKSFAEFLLARRVVRLIQQMVDALRRFRLHGDRGWDETMALSQWIAVCGPSGWPVDLFSFVCREVAHYPQKKVWGWQKQLSHLMGHLLKNGVPMATRERLTYREMAEQALHAERALLAALNACARHTDHRSPGFVPDATRFGIWLGRLHGQRTNAQPGVLAWLSHLDLSGSILSLRDLYGANLYKTSLRRADLFSANLTRACLVEADLRGANLRQAHLRGVRLRGADMRGANLTGADLTGVDPQDVKRTPVKRTRIQPSETPPHTGSPPKDA